MPLGGNVYTDQYDLFLFHGELKLAYKVALFATASGQ